MALRLLLVMIKGIASAFIDCCINIFTASVSVSPHCAKNRLSLLFDLGIYAHLESCSFKRSSNIEFSVHDEDLREEILNFKVSMSIQCHYIQCAGGFTL